jgi:hypothetical protein
MATDIETIPGFDLIIPLQLTYPNFIWALQPKDIIYFRDVSYVAMYWFQ